MITAIASVIWWFEIVYSSESLRISGISDGSNGVSITWSAIVGGQYRLQVSESLNEQWTNLSSLAATNNVIAYTDTSSTSLESRFYRLKVDTKELREVRSWAYNIGDVDTPTQREELVGTHFDMYVLEPVVTEKGKESFDIAGLVRDIRSYAISNYHKNPLVLAYVDVGQAETWRWYWQSGWGVGNPEWIVAADPDGWTGCYQVAYWHPEWHDIVIYATNGRSHLEEVLKAGFDGIYMDWVGAFSETEVEHKASEDGTNATSAMFDLIEKIRVYARQESSNANPSFLVVAQNAPDLYQANPSLYTQLVDAIAVEGIWFDGDAGFDDWEDPRGYNVPTDSLYPGWTEELLNYLEPMKGKLPIFCCEYAQDVGGTNFASLVYTNLAVTNGFIPYCSRRSLQRLSKTPYPYGYWPLDY